jgi:hypothetical protein
VNGLGRGCKGQHAFYKLDLGILTLFLFLLFLVMFLRGIKRLSGSIVSRYSLTPTHLAAFLHVFVVIDLGAYSNGSQLLLEGRSLSSSMTYWHTARTR